MPNENRSDAASGRGHEPRYEEMVRLLEHIYGPEPDPVMENPALLSQILQAADKTSSWAELQDHFPELGRQMEQYPELREAYELFVTMEQMEERNAELNVSASIADRLRDAVAQGKQWVIDAMGNVALVLDPGGQLSTSGAVLRSQDASEQPLHQISVTDVGALGAWDITATVFAESEHTCRVEVSLYSNDLDAELEGIAVTLQRGDAQTRQKTDENGAAFFVHVPRDGSEAAILQVDLRQG